MSPAIPAAGAVGTVGGAAARRVKTHWDRGHEGPKLIARIGRRVKQDAEVPHEIRERLAAALPARIRLDPDVQGAVSSLLDGEDVVAAQDALAEAIARLSADVVEWPTGFGATEFGNLAAAHAASAVNEVKATDREAAHVDQLATREILSEIKAAVSEPRAGNHAIGALLRGPLKQVGEEANAAAATKHQDEGRFAEAAQLAHGVADALEDADLSPAAVTFRLWAAQLLAAGDERTEAQDVLERMAWAHMDTPLHTAALSAMSELRRIAGDEWLIRGLDAIESWPRAHWAARWLDEAIVADERSDVALRWRAARVKIAALFETDQEKVLSLTEGLDGPVETGARLDLELDRLDALEAVQGQAAADSAWEKLSDWVETGASTSDQARAWQRRGCTMAARGDLEATRRAFRKVLRVWEQHGGSSAPASDAIFSLWLAESLLGDQTIDMAARGIAVNMRATGAPSRADARLHSADSLHLSNDLFRAHNDYWKSLTMYHDAGDLQGVHIVSNRLADLYDKSGRPAATLEMALSSGSGPRAAAAAAELDATEVDGLLAGAKAPWQREAAYHVFIQLGTRAHEQTVAGFVGRLLADSAAGPKVSPSERLPAIALEALGNVALQVPESDREAAFERLRAGARNTRLIDAGRACATGLLRATVLGLTDGSGDLIEVFLAREGADYVAPGDVGTLIAGDEGLRQRLISAAAEDNRQAPRALIHVQPTEDELATWQRAAEPLARKYVEEQVRIEIDLGDEIQWSINMSARFEEGGMAAVYAAPGTRHELLVHVLEIADDDTLPESVRASAMRAVHPMLRVLDEDDLANAAEAALKLASGQYVHSAIESPETDPLSNVQSPADTVGLLQANALVALGVIQQLKPGRFADELPDLITWASRYEKPWLKCAALEALGRASDVDVDIDLDVFIADAEPTVRNEALKLAKARAPERLKALLRVAVTDESVLVRGTALALARAVNDIDIVGRVAETDADAYLRGIAEIGLGELATTTSAQTAADLDADEGSNGS